MRTAVVAGRTLEPVLDGVAVPDGAAVPDGPAMLDGGAGPRGVVLPDTGALLDPVDARGGESDRLTGPLLAEQAAAKTAITATRTAAMRR